MPEQDIVERALQVASMAAESAEHNMGVWQKRAQTAEARVKHMKRELSVAADEIQRLRAERDRYRKALDGILNMKRIVPPIVDWDRGYNSALYLTRKTARDAITTGPK